MTELKASQPVLRATIKVTRKATGKVETFELVGHKAEEKVEQHGSDSQRSAPQHAG